MAVAPYISPAVAADHDVQGGPGGPARPRHERHGGTLAGTALSAATFCAMTRAPSEGRPDSFPEPPKAAQGQRFAEEGLRAGAARPGTGEEAPTP